MSLLTEDASSLLIGLGLASLGCLLAMKVTQQGKFLIWALGLLVLAGVVFGFERFWVTDAERVEAVVYDLGDAVQHSDSKRIKDHLDENVIIGAGPRTLTGGLISLSFALSRLESCHFDFVTISHLTTSVTPQGRVGKANFKATATGRFSESGNEMPISSLGTEWELTFREASPNVWKVTRIQAIKVPLEVGKQLQMR